MGDGMPLFSLRHKAPATPKSERNRIHTRPHVPDYSKAPKFDGNLNKALEYFAQTLGTSDDYMVRIIEVNGRSSAILFFHTISDERIIESALSTIHQHKFPKRVKKMAQYLVEKVFTGTDAIFMTNLFELREAIASGGFVVLMDGSSPAIVIGAQFVEHRTPQQPTLESSSRGPQVGFVEELDTNVGLLRRTLKTDALQVKKMRIGYRSRTEVAVLYMEDVTNPLAVETVLRRLSEIHVDHVGQSSAIEQRIVDNHWTIFPLTRVTQRVDSTGRVLNQGKIAIIVDGDPTVLLMPSSLIDFFQTEEDYSHTFYEATFTRWLRMIAFVFALYLPALYIAFVDFNPELLPKVLGEQIAESREGVPFPAVVEVCIMQIVIEILREATLRMPKQMGQSISIVGGLVVGEASVQAGLVSNILIIVVALTAISVFVTPSYEFTVVLRLGSWVMIGAATVFGLYGVLLASILMLYHLASLKSFGISYLDPFNGDHIGDLFTDGIFRMPTWLQRNRTEHLHPIDMVGQSDYDNPVPHPQLENATRKNSTTNHPKKGG